MTSKHVSVVILTARRAEKLMACLKSLERQSFMDFEVILVESVADPETEKIIHECALDIHHIVTPTASSYAEARNIGSRRAVGEFIAFIDDDCVADPFWLEHLLESAASADAVGGAVIPLKELPFPDWWDGALNWLIGVSEPAFVGSAGGSAHYPQTCNMLIRRDILADIKFQEIGGGFDQRQTRRYAGREDVELWRRLRLGGCRCAISPCAVVYHDIPPERLRYAYLLRRALNDGIAYWRREKKSGYVNWAVMDILTFLTDVWNAARRGKKIRYAFKTHLPWRVRQTGFLCGYAAEGFPPARLAHIGYQTALRGVRYAVQMLKRPLRKAYVSIRKPAAARCEIPARPESLLVAACGYLGDMVLIAPVLQALRCSLKGSKITLLCHENGRLLLDKSGLVDEIITLPGAVAGKNFDAVMVPYYHHATPQPVFFNSGAPVVTFDRDVGLPRRLWYDMAKRRIRKDFTIHEIINLSRLAAEVGMTQSPQSYRFSVPEEAKESANAILKQAGINSGKLVLLHAGAAYFEKAWQLDNWMLLASHIRRESGAPPVFIGDNSLHKEIEKGLHSADAVAVNICGRTDLWALAAVIARADVLVTTDSGPKHLAMALGTPTITLYGPTDERRWGALWGSERHTVVRAVPADLTAEEMLGLPPDFAMRQITPEMVMNHLRSLFTLEKSG
jgi:ADP-heptose:LPS heptosyltransferase/GT2 family glycosyltransferase